jgi:hypothetical protein
MCNVKDSFFSTSNLNPVLCIIYLVQDWAVSVKLADPISKPAATTLPYDGAKLYRSASMGRLSFRVGDVVELHDDDEECDLPLLGLVQCIFQGCQSSEPEIQVQPPS